MKVQNYGSNQTLIEDKGCQVLYSYQTPVALIVRDGSDCGLPVRAYKTDQFHSVTTSKHINKFLREESYGAEVNFIPQEVMNDWRECEFVNENYDRIRQD